MKGPYVIEFAGKPSVTGLIEGFARFGIPWPPAATLNGFYNTLVRGGAVLYRDGLGPEATAVYVIGPAVRRR